MAEKEDNKATEEAKGPPKPSLRERLPQILLWGFIILNTTIMVGGAGAIYMIALVYEKPSINEESETHNLALDRDIRNGKPVLYTFEPFTVNLDGRMRKLVRTTIQVEMLSEEGYEEAVELTPVVRDEIVRILNSKKYEDVESIQGKLFLKDQIITAMNNLLKKGSVKELYFGEFVVQ